MLNGKKFKSVEEDTAAASMTMWLQTGRKEEVKDLEDADVELVLVAISAEETEEGEKEDAAVSVGGPWRFNMV